MDEDGYFFIVDRKKDMIISGGFNVYPRVIEEAVYEHPDVEEAIVIGVPDAYRGEAAKAFVKLRDGQPAAHARGAAGVPRRQDRPARDAGGARNPRRTCRARRRQAVEEGARRGGAREGAMREAS